MKLLSVTALISAGVVVAQSGLGQVPKCAQPCVTKFTTGGAIAGCNGFDAKCICENETFLSDIACCLVGECTDQEQKETVDFARNICASVQVDNLPDEVVCKSGETTGSATKTTASGAASTSVSAETGSASESATESPTTTADTTTADAASSEETDSDNAGPMVTLAPVGVLGGLIAAVAML